MLVTTRLEPAKLTGLQCLALDTLAETDALKLLERYRPIPDDAEWKAAVCGSSIVWAVMPWLWRSLRSTCGRTRLVTPTIWQDWRRRGLRR